MEKGIEHRRSGRRRTLFGGVLFDRNGKKWDCKISNISDTGAQVKTVADLKLGDFIEIKINKFNDLRRAEIMWAGKDDFGIRFLVKINKNQEKMSELFKIVGK